MNNQLKQLQWGTLKRLKLEIDESGEYKDPPFTWSHLNLATDMGPDMICMIHFLGYSLGLNVNADFDPSHGSHNSSKGVLNECGL